MVLETSGVTLRRLVCVTLFARLPDPGPTTGRRAQSSHELESIPKFTGSHYKHILKRKKGTFEHLEISQCVFDAVEFVVQHQITFETHGFL